MKEIFTAPINFYGTQLEPQPRTVLEPIQINFAEEIQIRLPSKEK